MGDGAEKIKSVLDEIGAPVADIMASDEFVRGHSFLGCRVKKLSEIEELYGEDFFENYVLLFVGDAVSSESVEYRYSSCVKTEDKIVITVDEIVPEKCVSRPACKYIAIPYLRSEYSGEPVSYTHLTLPTNIVV